MSRVTVIHPDIPNTIEWDIMSGGDLTHNNTRYRTDAVGPEKVWNGRKTRDNIQVEAFVDPAAHAGFIAQLNAGYGFVDTTIRVVSLDNAGVEVGEPDTYKGCCVAKYTPRKVDLSSEDLQKLGPIEWEAPAP
jgi:hypothetical protein